jgi:hypothetical protein
MPVIQTITVSHRSIRLSNIIRNPGSRHDIRNMDISPIVIIRNLDIIMEDMVITDMFLFWSES